MDSLERNSPLSVSDGFACDSGALDAEQRSRQRHLTAAIAVRCIGTKETADGYCLLFHVDDDRLLLDVAEWITLERRCCPFHTSDSTCSRQRCG